MTRAKAVQIGTALTLIAVAVAFRLLPHPANFAPAMAIALFAGAVLPPRLALTVPLAALAVSDLIIGFYPIMPIVWGCYLVVALVSGQWLRRPNLFRGAVLTVSASVFFFIVTNFAVWAFDTMYAHTWAGLAQCYIAAIPFFRNSLLSDLFYSGLLFGLNAFVLSWARGNEPNAVSA